MPSNWARSDWFRSASLATKTHKLPTLFGQNDFPAEIGPGGGKPRLRHAVDDHADAFVHVGYTERSAPRELGLIGQQVGTARENHLSARLRRHDRIVGHATILGETADADEGDVGTHAVDPGRGARAEGRLIVVVDL